MMDEYKYSDWCDDTLIVAPNATPENEPVVAFTTANRHGEEAGDPVHVTIMGALELRDYLTAWLATHGQDGEEASRDQG